MTDLKNITVTDVLCTFTVNSISGEKETISNRRSYGLSFCIDGQITYTHNGKKVISNKSCAIILPKNQTYFLERNKKGIFPVINFDCVEPLCDTVISIPIENPEQYIKDFELIKKFIILKENRLKCISIFYGILHKLSQSNKIGILSPAINYIENNFSDPTLNNLKLASLCGISEVYLRKLFLKSFSTTPKQFIIDIRINKAKQMLTDANLKISAISEECGFSSPYHFCRLFKEKEGLTPTEYMKANHIYKI